MKGPTPDEERTTIGKSRPQDHGQRKQRGEKFGSANPVRLGSHMIAADAARWTFLAVNVLPWARVIEGRWFLP